MRNRVSVQRWETKVSVKRRLSVGGGREGTPGNPEVVRVDL